VTAIAVASPAGRQSLFAHGPQGFSETLYAYLSQADNNGSAFAGYAGFVQPVPGNVGAHGLAFPDLAGGIVMTFGRFVPVLARPCAGGFTRAAPAGARRSGDAAHRYADLAIFIIGFVVVFALLNFLAALVLGPLDQSLTSHLYR
jgi:K+-transporting ATPase ATPase A chain